MDLPLSCSVKLGQMQIWPTFIRAFGLTFNFFSHSNLRIERLINASLISVFFNENKFGEETPVLSPVSPFAIPRDR